MQDSGKNAETAWGRWVKKQPTGVFTRAQRETGLAYSTVHRARWKRMTLEVALALSRFSRGAVRVEEIVRKRRQAA